MTRFLGMIPVPPKLQSRSRVHDLKSRLDWGEPALTIIDARDRTEFNQGHVMGAISIPMKELVKRSLTRLELDRDIYVYGVTDDETAIAATHLRNAGYSHVSELRGGVAAWKAVGYPVESALIARAS
ncbi:MAG: rhodanese-like domain-containing protein [Oculatellaceae cyanobacterium bins.114]|nr:rhodanese-like domain-containing protein [Oculatellaceae cyanobacterium bins.114]